MDIPRPGVARARRIRRLIYGVLSLTAVIAISVGVSRLEPAAPSVDRATVWMGKVKRGSMTRQVRGFGRLAPEEIRWLPAETSGHVERILLRPGVVVRSDTVLLELTDPELEQAVFEADLWLGGRAPPTFHWPRNAQTIQPVKLFSTTVNTTVNQNESTTNITKKTLNSPLRQLLSSWTLSTRANKKPR